MAAVCSCGLAEFADNSAAWWNAERDGSLDAEPNPANGSAAAPLHLLWARLLHDAEPWCCLVNIKDPLMPTGPSHSPSFSPLPHSPALPTHNHLDPLPGSIRTSAIEITGTFSTSYKNSRAAITFSFIYIAMQKPPPAHHPPSNNFDKSTS
ncbi:hypothetical protein PGT21_017576 [Puccinia graminis f. sp. tritici]|uniref:Uncharacterized protein n=1 Tax=Puccinia graminis f. sp. tritici TaxID=56615 RepID=A0A5B0M195_PUCGR|nr:hypothetical protein PGT21_017576 [Puccinia graminis f. sp. tritici]